MRSVQKGLTVLLCFLSFTLSLPLMPSLLVPDLLRPECDLFQALGAGEPSSGRPEAGNYAWKTVRLPLAKVSEQPCREKTCKKNTKTAKQRERERERQDKIERCSVFCCRAQQLLTVGAAPPLQPNEQSYH